LLGFTEVQLPRARLLSHQVSTMVRLQRFSMLQKKLSMPLVVVL
jgi:hypothetical protein